MKNLQNRSGPVAKVSESRLNQQKLKGKPKCPRCGNVLMFVYDSSKGFTNQKCHKCGAKVLVDLDTLDCRLVIKEDQDALES